MALSDTSAERWPGSSGRATRFRLRFCGSPAICTIELTNYVIAQIESLSVGAQLEDVPEKAPFGAGRGPWSKFLRREI